MMRREMMSLIDVDAIKTFDLGGKLLEAPLHHITRRLLSLRSVSNNKAEEE
jgi:hypothetical protein